MITYARSRLWVGILSVGSWVLLSLYILLNIKNLPNALRDLPLSLSILSFLGFYLAISVPFDFIGGFILPHKYERSMESLQQYILSYFRGITFHGIFLYLISHLFLVLLNMYPISELLVPLLVYVLCLQVILALLQPYIARLIGKFTISNSSNPTTQYEIWDSTDIGFTGGIPFFRNKSILPKKWVEDFSPDEINLLLNRRNFLKNKSAHFLGISGAILFNLIGVAIGYLGLLYSGITIVENGYFAILLFWSSSISLWSFIGLLILPTLSQKATIFGDSAWKSENKNIIIKLISNLDALQDLEPKRQPQIQKIFHPIASVEIRIQSLGTAHTNSLVSWHIARYTLFYSWSILSFLGRAVHCNVGRPHLWVFLPSDG